MNRGFYTVGSGMLVQQRNLNVIGNNIVNSQTPGYRAERVITSTFEQELVTRLENGKYVRIGTADQIATVEEVETVFDESSLYESGNPFDLAICGDGFFNVRDGENTFLTRNGCFNVDDEGYLVLDEIGRVQGTNGDIYIGGSDFRVDLNGDVYDMNGNLAGTLAVSKPAENAEMIKFENSYFLTDEVVVADDYVVRQGVYERSNIDMTDEYTRLIEAQAAFKACSTALSIIDQLNSKSASQIASVN
ncbi:MAG: flagellar hook-basal body protein [Oscillospiraceae bacterium]|nr:flagellar hook-basal body protein [Oscillospiraceae bacterium]